MPVKARSAGKQRLAAALPDETRTLLVRTMLEHVLSVLKETPAIGQVIVTSPDPEPLPSAVRLLADTGGGLNAALEAAIPALIAGGATRALIVFADLPLLTREDIAALLAHPADVALAPDHTGTGTNGLSVSVPTRFRFQFGPDSCARHLAEAGRLGLTAAAIGRPGLAFDLDEPADLEKLRALAHPRYAFLA